MIGLQGKYRNEESDSKFMKIKGTRESLVRFGTILTLG